jgi:SAM-dependent methyltransferase
MVHGKASVSVRQPPRAPEIVGIYRAIDIADRAACLVAGPATWERALREKPTRLYAGKLSRALPQFPTHWGLTPFYPSSRNIPHDLVDPFPIPSDCISVFQAEDVFEHIELDQIPPIIAEVHRILEPGGLFRFSVPDYHCEAYRARTLCDAEGELLFDPYGEGYLEDGRVCGGGHVWFPTIDKVRELFAGSPFKRVDYLHYNNPDGSAVLEPIDHSLGLVRRTPEHDDRSTGPISIVVDAWKLD